MVRILYIILLCAAALFYPLYRDDLSYVMLCALIVLPVIMLIELIIGAVFLRCSMPKKSGVMYKDSEEEFCVTLTNNSVFPLSGCKIRIKAVFRPTGEVKYYTAQVPLPALRTQTVSVNIGAKHCGAVDISLEYVKVYDLLRLFSVKRFRKEHFTALMYIIPAPESRYLEEARELLRIGSIPCGEDMTESGRGGGMPGDVIGYREFSPGDRLSLINFKLSARFDSDIVKILPSADSKRYLLTGELSERENLSARDDTLQRLMSLAYYLNRENAAVYVACPAGSGCECMPITEGEAALCCDNASYARIAGYLAACGDNAFDSENGYINVTVTDMQDE